MVQSAEKGTLPEVMHATEKGLEQRALYGLTGRMVMIGPVAHGSLELYAHDKAIMEKLWDWSENETEFSCGSILAAESYAKPVMP